MKSDPRGCEREEAKSEETVGDLDTTPPCKAVIAKHCLALGYVNMAEENV